MDRRKEAFDAARRILETLEEAGLNYTNPDQLYNDMWKKVKTGE